MGQNNMLAREPEGLGWLFPSAGGVQSGVCSEDLRRGTAEGLHEGADPANQGVHCVDVMAAQGELRAHSSVEGGVGHVLVLRDAIVS